MTGQRRNGVMHDEGASERSASWLAYSSCFELSMKGPNHLPSVARASTPTDSYDDSRSRLPSGFAIRSDRPNEFLIYYYMHQQVWDIKLIISHTARLAGMRGMQGAGRTSFLRRSGLAYRGPS